jgi:hypothetical protein
MYTAIIIILALLGIWLISKGTSKKQNTLLWGGILLLVATFAFFGFMGFWGEYLWFESIGYHDRFIKEIAIKALLILIGAVAGFVLTWFLTFSIKGKQKSIRWTGSIIGLVFGGIWGFSNWATMLLFINRTEAGISEPILNLDASFYLFSLPLLNALYVFFFVIFLLSGISSYLSAASRDGANLQNMGLDSLNRFPSFFLSGGLLLVLLGIGKFLNRYELLYSNWGVVAGPGWTDVKVRLPMYWASFIITSGLGIAMLLPGLRKAFFRMVQVKQVKNADILAYSTISTATFVLATWLILLTVVPGLLQWLVVQPNEITMERPFIENNIKLTRYGFNLQDIEENLFAATEQFRRQLVKENPEIFDNIRLWDWRALDAVYKQFQEIRLYYEFKDVDIDRYHFDDNYNQVMVSAREMKLENLPAQSQTFVNKRFKYTHGHGITMTKVNEFTENGLPNLLIKDIPPKNKYPELEVTQPRIYYGELTNTPVVVNSEEEEFDYPSGEKNVYYRYEGNGGVQISNTWRKFLFGWKFDGTRFFLSSYPQEKSRLMFYRQIQERINKLANFLDFDDDAYIVLANGQLYWIIDAYTKSKYFPYSEPYTSESTVRYDANRQRVLRASEVPHLQGANYVRNSVKTVINAYTGDVKFYVFEPDDPLVKTWDKVFPGVFLPRDEMPGYLEKHVRYPLDMLTVQGLVYAKYHMTDPTVFYNQEDLWIRATEKYYNNIQPVDPYYIMWEPPGSDEAEFVLMQPYTPKNRQVLIGWIAGMCDGDNYGRFLAYKFPKEKRILGPQQVETKIDQDSFLSGQLTLWDQRGSNVIRGNVLAIPVSGTIIYVEPIYLQSETAAYPELRLVAIMHNDRLSYAESFDKALEGLYTGEVKPPMKPSEEVVIGGDMEKLIQQANQAFERYLQQMGNQDFEDAGNALNDLKESLRQLEEGGE